jgi:hypothetical protein
MYTIIVALRYMKQAENIFSDTCYITYLHVWYNTTVVITAVANRCR